MWSNITRADLDQAKERLKIRCEETLRRHAEEISDLDAEQADVETLDRMVTEFSRKFKIAAISSSESSGAEEQALPSNTDEASTDSDEGSTDSMEPASLYPPMPQLWPSRVA